MFRTLEYESRGPLAFLRLNRPEKLNAINAQMVSELNDALDEAEADEQVRVIVVSGNGRAFSAGFDLAGGEGDDIGEELQADFDLIMRFWHSSKVTLAAVHGYCLGGAMEMAVACDITLTSSDCRFGAPEVRFGSGIVAMILPWLIGPKRAKELLLTGDDRVSAERALSLGLVNRVVEPDELMDQARDVAREIAGNDSHAVRLTKEAINRSYEVMGMPEALAQALELDRIIENTETPESREFNRILREQGAKAAVAWRRNRLDADPQREDP